MLRALDAVKTVLFAAMVLAPPAARAESVAAPPPSASPSALASATPLASAPPVTIAVPSIGGNPWTPDGIATLKRDLDTILDNAAAIRGAHVGVLAIDTRTGTTLYQRNADDAFQPASTLKLVVGSAALDKLGPDFRFVTRGYAVPGARAPSLLVFAGDPFLITADLGSFADAVARLGLRHTTLFLVGNRDQSNPYPEGWTWDDFAYDYAAPVSAYVLNENVLDIEVGPGSKAWGPAVIRSAPFATVVSAGKSVPDLRSGAPIVVTQALTLERGATSTLDVSRTGPALYVRGGIALGSPPESVAAAVPDARQYALCVAVAQLREKHVEIDPPSAGYFPFDAAAPPASALIWSHESPSLAEFLGPRFWIPSDNLVAELVLRELGFRTGGGGTTGKGIAFERSWLQSIGVDPATTTLADGSGMSQYDRITPRDLVTVLQHDWNGPNRELVLNSLPVGGARGTIEGIAGTPAAGRVFAKTGSMMHVRGLAGYLATQRHGAVTFVFTVDDWLGDYPALAALRANVLSRIVQD